jgi:hypothetical protein
VSTDFPVRRGVPRYKQRGAHDTGYKSISLFPWFFHACIACDTPKFRCEACLTYTRTPGYFLSRSGPAVRLEIKLTVEKHDFVLILFSKLMIKLTAGKYRWFKNSNKMQRLYHLPLIEQ